ncbi:hypothetical protein FJZ53_00910 [Candidatus Woesearchaeota archaeon]|nr:hypothetical protein [Candidatus Woesearchaeota archaeon]
MKRRIMLLLVLAVLLMPAVLAKIDLNTFGKYYNKGEPLLIDSKIVEDVTVEDGILRFRLICDKVSFDIFTKEISLSPKTAKPIVIDDAIIPSTAEGNCVVKASLVSNGVIVDEVFSNRFIVTDELKAYGDFQVNPLQLQLGNTLTLYGYLTSMKETGAQINGLATVYFKTDEKTYYAKDVAVSQGKLKYYYTVMGNIPGDYTVDVLVTDVFGNKKLFENVAMFSIVDQVHVFVEPLQSKILPGDLLQILGEVNTLSGEPMKEGVLQIKLGTEAYTAMIRDGKFLYELRIPADIETGTHVLRFFFNEDQSGNQGSTQRSINIEAVPTKIKINVFQPELKPKDVLEAAAYVYDQAGDEIIDQLRIELIDANGRSIYLGSVESEGKIIIPLPEYSIPGSWKLKASYADLTTGQEFIVEKVKSVDVQLEGQNLYILNTGNVDYNEAVDVSLNNGEFTLKKEVSLKPGAVLVVDLTQEAPAGEYMIAVTGNAVMPNQFDNIIVLGKNKTSLNIIYSALLALIITTLIYLTIFKKEHLRNAEVAMCKNKREGETMLKELRALKENSPRKSTFSSTEESIEDFRSRMLRSVRETEEKEREVKHYYASEPYRAKRYEERKKDDGKGKGLFNMFG